MINVYYIDDEFVVARNGSKLDYAIEDIKYMVNEVIKKKRKNTRLIP